MGTQIVNTGTVTVVGTGGITVIEIQNWRVSMATVMVANKAENDLGPKGHTIVGVVWTVTAEGQDGTLPSTRANDVTWTLNGQDSAGDSLQLISKGTLETMDIGTAHEGAGTVTIGGTLHKSDGAFFPFTTSTGF